MAHSGSVLSISSSTIVMQSSFCRDNIGKAYNEVCLLVSYAASDELRNVYVESILNSSPPALVGDYDVGFFETYSDCTRIYIYYQYIFIYTQDSFNAFQHKLI